MTHARDPLVVIEALRTALKDVEWTGREWFEDRDCAACPSCLRRMDQGHTLNCRVAKALALSAPLPAPERPSAEEVVRLVDALEGAARYEMTIKLDEDDSFEPDDLSEAEAITASRRDDLLSALRRAIGGGE